MPDRLHRGILRRELSSHGGVRMHNHSDERLGREISRKSTDLHVAETVIRKTGLVGLARGVTHATM